MSGTGQVLRPGLGFDGREDGDGAVGRANAGSHAHAGINRFAESGAMHRGVDWRHKRKVELVAALLGEREADQAAAVLGHEVDGFRSDFFGGHGEVAFVLAVFVVHEDDHATVADFFDGFFDGAERCFGCVSHWDSL